MVELLLNLPDGYLTEDYGELRQFPTMKKDASTPQFSGGQVIQFSERQKG